MALAGASNFVFIFDFSILFNWLAPIYVLNYASILVLHILFNSPIYNLSLISVLLFIMLALAILSLLKQNLLPKYY